MGKYDPLEGHLRRQKAASYDMTFRDIERVLGGLLPKRAHRPDWWANPEDPATHSVQSKAWLRSGYRAALVGDDEQVRFTRIEP